MNPKKKLIRVTTTDLSLDSLLVGQLRFLNQYYEVVGLSSNTGLLKKVSEREGIRVIEVPMERSISLKQDWKCLWQLVKVFKKEKPYIVHTNTPKGSLLSMIAAKITRVPNRIYYVTGLRYQGATGLFRLILKTMERITCLCATKVIPEGNGVKKALLGDHITHKTMEIIHNGNINGKDTSYYSPEAVSNELKASGIAFEGSARDYYRKQIGLSPNDFAFIFIGRIVNDKGMNELSQAMRELNKKSNNTKLLLVGSFEQDLDPLVPQTEEFFHNNKCVLFVGEQSDVRPYLMAADALVFPSYREGFPNVVLEAGAMELPSIVTDINGCNEIIVNGKNGVIIPPKNSNELFNAMTYFTSHPKEIKEMAKNARPMIISRFKQEDVWKALLNMYQSL